MKTSAPSIPTIGVIARQLKRPTHQIEYVIRTRGIQPVGCAGNARVFDEEAVEAIAHELGLIEAVKRREHRYVASVGVEERSLPSESRYSNLEEPTSHT